MRRRHSPVVCIAIVAATLAIACGPSTRPAPESLAGDEVGERIVEAHALERTLERLGLVVHGERAFGAYLQSVGERIARGRRIGSVRPRFAVLWDPSANALALPNGAIYVHTGLLARLENEAQLAQVLAHELSHVVRGHRKEPRHMPAGDVHGTSGDAAMMASLGAAAPARTIGAFPRRAKDPFAVARERQADLDAIEALAAAGYATSEAARLYELLGDGNEATPYRAFDTHPTAAERAEAVRGDGGPARGALHAEAYLRATREIAVRNVALCVERRRFRLALEEVARSRRLRGDDPRLDALEAEARRALSGGEPADRREARAASRIDVPVPEPVTGSVIRDRRAGLDSPDAGRRAALAALPVNALR